MDKLLALCLLLVLPALAAADVEGMVWISPDFYIDIYEYPNQRGAPPHSRRHLGRSGIALRSTGQTAVYRTGMAERPAPGRRTSRTPMARNSSRGAAIRALPSMGSGSAGRA